ncbi:MAG: Unknown protein [uncultured Thiotrichaceae bacterium]|uniref:Uncharacterized protein n=1 Tax=uncultured Thiotrichaceae bacterium TaxID=298394 RepID=A0A6S6THF2_9GAMM|nr:MAG: Unknown protein [uncultured Thiotrichaceae bacterium]
MPNKYTKLIAPLALSLFSTPALAQAQAAKATPSVLKIIELSGRALIEMPNGKQAIAKKGSYLPDGAKLLVLEKGSATGRYIKSKCEIKYRQNTVVNVREDAQCLAGTPVINANQYAKFGTAANDGCCVVRTITTPAVRPVIPTSNAATNIAANSFLNAQNTLPLVLGGAAGIYVISEILDDDPATP